MSVVTNCRVREPTFLALEQISVAAVPNTIHTVVKIIVRIRNIYLCQVRPSTFLVFVCFCSGWFGNLVLLMIIDSDVMVSLVRQKHFLSLFSILQFLAVFIIMIHIELSLLCTTG